MKLHRDPELRDMVDFVRTDMGVDPGYYARNMAARVVCPELLERAKGKGGLESITDEVLQAYCSIVLQKIGSSNQ